MTAMGFRLGEGSVGAAYMRPVVGRQKGRVAYMRPLHTPVRRGKDETRSCHIDLTLSSGEAAYRRARPRTGREMFVPPSFDTALTRLLRMRGWVLARRFRLRGKPPRRERQKKALLTRGARRCPRRGVFHGSAAYASTTILPICWFDSMYLYASTASSSGNVFATMGLSAPDSRPS